MKKYLALMLAVLMLLSLCACGNKDEEPEEIENTPGTDTVMTQPAQPSSDPNSVHVNHAPGTDPFAGTGSSTDGSTNSGTGSNSGTSPAASPAPTSAPKPSAVPKPTPTPIPINPQPASTPRPTAPPAPAVPDVSISAESAVYTLVDESGSFTDSDGSSINYHYRVPAFGCSGPDTELLSVELYNAVMPSVDTALANIQNGQPAELKSADYNYYIGGDFVSVLTRLVHTDGTAECSCVTLNTSTGFNVSRSELLSYAGINEADLPGRISAAAGSKFSQVCGSPDSAELADAYNRTIDPSNFSNAELLIGEGGQLAAIVKLYNAAGCSEYAVVI